MRAAPANCRRAPRRGSASSPAMQRILRNHRGERLDFAFHPGREGDRRLVAIAHGVTSHKDRPWLTALSDALGKRGIASVRFTYSGNGASEGRYEDVSISKEVDDLGAVLEALSDRDVIYAGHSMGGAVGVLRASRDIRLRGLVSLAGMVHVQSFMQRWFGNLRPGIDVQFDKPQCPLTAQFLADAAAIGDVLAPAARVRVPWLLVHGTSDELVPFQDALDAQRANPRHTTLLEIPGADHRFTGCEVEVAEKVAAWCARL